MSDEAGQMIELAVGKAKANPAFSADLINYLKYLVLERCPQERLSELGTIFRYGKLYDLLSFGFEVAPDCGVKITAYVKAYR